MPERAFLDANVLVYALYADAPQHAASRFLVEEILHGNRTAFLSPQILSEMYAVVTDRRRVTNPRSPEEASSVIETLVNCPFVTMLQVTHHVSRRLAKLARAHDIRAADIFDAQIVATMMEHGVKTVCTYNARDFVRYTAVRVVSPED